MRTNSVARPRRAVLALAAVAALGAGCGGSRAGNFDGTYTGTTTLTYMTTPAATVTYSQVIDLEDGTAVGADVLLRFSILLPAQAGNGAAALDCVLPATREGDRVMLGNGQTCELTLSSTSGTMISSALVRYTVTSGSASIAASQLTMETSGSLSGMANDVPFDPVQLGIRYVGTRQ